MRGCDMATSFEIDGSFAIVTCEGEFTVDNIRDIIDWVNTEPSLPDKIKLLIDDKSTDFDPTTVQLEEIAEMYGSIKDRITSRWALVVAKEYHFGLGRMYSVFAERYGLDARVFTTVAEARAWLDQKEPSNQ
jgi:hypothetical protein